MCIDIYELELSFDQGPNRAKNHVSGSQLLLSQMPLGYPLVARGCLLSFGGPGLFSGLIPVIV